MYQRAREGFLHVLDALRVEIRAASQEIDQQAKRSQLAQRLCTLPGVGHYTALLVLAEIGDVHRFPSPKHLVSYAGLAPTVHASAGRTFIGHLSKQGSAWLRWILVEAAQQASYRPGRFAELYRRLAQRKGAKIAKVSVARKLLTTIYWMLQHA